MPGTTTADRLRRCSSLSTRALRAAVIPAIMVAVIAAAVTGAGAFTGDALAGGLLFIPPARADVSPITMSTGERTAPGLHVLAGIHWASVTPNPRTRFDIGVGYLYERYAAPDSYGASDRPGVIFADADSMSEPRTELHGVYLEYAHRQGGNRHQRRWLGLRGELLLADVGGATGVGAGVTARGAWEALAPVVGGGRGAAVIGALAIGGYLEVGYRLLPDGQGAVQATAGLSVRVPLLVAGN